MSLWGYIHIFANDKMMICFVSYAMNFRKENLDAFVKKYGIKLGFMSIFSKASAYALQDQPVVNAVIDGQVKISIRKKQTTCGIRAKFNQFNCNILSIFGTGLSRI